MKVKVGDYIEGSEYYGSNIRRVKGWVEQVGNSPGSLEVLIRCDDGYKGRRKNTVYEDLGDIIVITKANKN